jgi:hypothetical protein
VAFVTASRHLPDDRGPDSTGSSSDDRDQPATAARAAS